MSNSCIHLFSWLLPNLIKKISYKDYKNFIYIQNVFSYPIFFFLKNSSLYQYNCLIDIAVVDSVEKKKRFLVLYTLVSTFFNNRITVIFSIEEFIKKNTSLVSLFASVCWAEREVWDMYGIAFYKHPDLRRILTDYGFSGSPLRKDFPLSGFVELNYNSKQEKLTYNKVILTQEYRNFSFGHSYWDKKFFSNIAKKVVGLYMYKAPISQVYFLVPELTPILELNKCDVRFIKYTIYKAL